MRDVSIRYLSPEEVAYMTGTHPETVRQECRAGRIPGATQKARHGRWRIPVESVDTYVGGEVQ